MNRIPHRLAWPIVLALGVSACSEKATVPDSAEVGPNPVLPEPKTSIVPTVNPAKAVGWPEGQLPEPAEGLSVGVYANRLDHPRWLYVLPNGDVLVAESNAPEGSGGFSGIKGWIAGLIMDRAGAGVPSADRITLLRDVNDDGMVDLRTVFLDDLHSPFGMELVGNDLYVANTDALMKFPYRDGQTEITEPGTKVTDLPAGELNHHWTKNVIAGPEGERLYVTVGSNSNVGENGMAVEENRAAVLEVNPDTGDFRVFANGLRNPVGLAWQPQSGELWTTVNERDELGDHLVPDYMTAVHDGDFYGWPYSYWGQNLDPRVKPQRPELVETALEPDYALGAHTASLGLAFYDHDRMPQYRNGALVGQHGSWNRKIHSGYKVIFVPFENGEPAGPPQDVLAGFLSEDEEALGRPVGVAVANDGAILVADDVGNIIWRVVPDS
ncbi:PQQ-dependent sugar dehydrogenase [Saccharospirillum salsuginis]|uniref:Sorbosone dehydrogenase n=1 Tax=Saccharospirillum salsuginis TaxID=418750 RepID=A0A918K4R5_9GAMM|nr:sorbosone dehydrogenase family protein [Saccharospirillum salsuginis]GGX46193.1 sorbosone dehydrogenase [Saccharospirillum salsuginis]